MDLLEREKLRKESKEITFFLIILGTPLLLLFLAFGLPLIGNFTALTLADFLECAVTSSKPQPCYIFGRDIGEVLYNYAVTSLVGGIANPVLFFQLLTAALPAPIVFAWFSALFVLYMYKRKAEIAGSDA